MKKEINANELEDEIEQIGTGFREAIDRYTNNSKHIATRAVAARELAAIIIEAFKKRNAFRKSPNWSTKLIENLPDDQKKSLGPLFTDIVHRLDLKLEVEDEYSVYHWSQLGVEIKP